MLSFEQWYKKSESSLEAAQILMEHDKPVEIINQTRFAMNVEPEIIKNNMSTRQKETLQLFKERLAKALPKVRIKWAKAYSDTIIEVYTEYDNATYNYSTGLETATLATDVTEETDVTIILL